MSPIGVPKVRGGGGLGLARGRAYYRFTPISENPQCEMPPNRPNPSQTQALTHLKIRHAFGIGSRGTQIWFTVTITEGIWGCTGVVPAGNVSILTAVLSVFHTNWT